jgi:hypothetical protein
MDGMGERPHMQLSDEELFARFAAQGAKISAAYAEYFELVRELDRRVEVAPVLRALRVERPHDVIRTARVLGELPELNKALAAGEVNRAHVRIAERTVRAVRKANPGAVDDAGLAAIDGVFTTAARDLPPRQFQTAADHLLATLDPDGGDTIDPRHLDRRELLIWDDPTGMVGVKGLLDPITGRWLKAAVDRWSKPEPAEPCEQEGLPGLRDPRSKGQRQADALQMVCRLALGARRDPDRPHLVIHTEAGSNTSTLSRAWFAPLVCDADLERLDLTRDGAVLDLGRKVRTATPVQRRTLIGRDRTCAIPGCTIPAEWCDAHHVEWWSKNGSTDVSNLAMVCGRHHAETHAGTWSLDMRDGIPWVKPPPWLDSEQRWRRNTFTHHRQAAEQLAAYLSPPPHYRR